MPLTPGAPVGDTIKELTNSGSRPRPHNQIVAIAEANARKGGVGVRKKPLPGRKIGIHRTKE